MDQALRNALVDAIRAHPDHGLVISEIDMASDATGHVTYNTENVWVDPSAPGFAQGRTAIGDEELVRAYLLLRLATSLGYDPRPERLEIERAYKAVGRPGKGGRVDLLVRGTKSNPNSDRPFLFIECKAPDKFDSDLKYLDGQLFRLSRQEKNRPRHLVYYTVELKENGLRERLILIDTKAFGTYEEWDAGGQPITDIIPTSYGIPRKSRFGNVPEETAELRPLDTQAGAQQLGRLREEIHDVIWGGGGTNNNEVFVLITRLILAKIYDEEETQRDREYQFQRLGRAVAPETPEDLVGRLNVLYREAEAAYLALPEPSPGPAFDTTRVAAEKIAFVVGRLEGISITVNSHQGDLLGEFFEQIVAQDFTQSKGQFFTPMKLVRFMLELCSAVAMARQTMAEKRDTQGRPRLPYVIDPSAGSGTFLIEYMKRVRRGIGTQEVADESPRRVAEAHASWFAGRTGNAWAKDFLFGIENNYDLGLAAKVNMVLHGDGSMNTWIKSGLLPFESYWIDGRNNVLGITQPEPPAETHYAAPVNEQFDLVLSNPPFSLKMSPDEKATVERSFDLMSKAQSEAIFIERWYQLLAPGGAFCCVLPEAVLDTSRAYRMRVFLLKHFKIQAVVSLPYDAFRPFTSTKTCIILATKRDRADVEAFETALATHSDGRSGDPTAGSLSAVFKQLGWDSERIFMAEPEYVGYKRRKGLADLDLPNDLYVEDNEGDVADATSGAGSQSVLQCFENGDLSANDARYGFWTTPEAVVAREGLRLDPKYRWLWDHMDGVAVGEPSRAVPLSDVLEIVKLPKVAKGGLDEDRRLIDLDAVESRQGILAPQVPEVDVVGSEKIVFEGCDLAFSKLEPYLGKVLLEPDPADIGSTEWVGLKISTEIPKVLVGYILMEPGLCRAYRRLQSGKRHARLDPEEMLDLRVELPPKSSWGALVLELQDRREGIVRLRAQESSVRQGMDELLMEARTDES